MLLSCSGVSKAFSGVEVLHGVDFILRAGEVHGLVGANGAGKSTLMKIISGAISDYRGEILLDGRPVRMSRPHEALQSGIAMVYQELSGIGMLSVAENVYLGRQPTGRNGLIDWPGMRESAQSVLKRVNLEIDVTRRLEDYSLSVRQLIEIARCLDAGSRIFILDEPTSALSQPEKERLFELIRQLRDEGKGIVFVSHFIEDVLEICDTVTILVDGGVGATEPASSLTKHTVIHEMLDGRDQTTEEALESAVTLASPVRGKPMVELIGLSLRPTLQEINLSIHPGESLGIYGFVGAGHQEVARCLAGSLQADSGIYKWKGERIPLPFPSDAVNRGIAFVSADRASALVPNAETYKNTTLAHLERAAGNWLTSRREVAVARPILEKVNCQPSDPFLHTASLSGGNQQKVVLARWLLDEICLLVLEEPTRGMDVEAKREVMEIVRQLKRKGTAILIASSEPELLLAHADRILVMHRGEITREFADCTVDKAELIRYA